MNDVEKLIAIEAIRQVKAKYCHFTDQKDSKAWAQLFTEDCEVDMRDCLTPRDPLTKEILPVEGFDNDWLTATMAGVAWPLKGRAAAYQFHDAQINGAGLTEGDDARTIATQHGIFNAIVDIDSDTTARAIWPLRVFAKYTPQSPISRANIIANYRETYQKVGKDWLIDTLFLEVIWLDLEGPRATND